MVLQRGLRGVAELGVGEAEGGDGVVARAGGLDGDAAGVRERGVGADEGLEAVAELGAALGGVAGALVFLGPPLRSLRDGQPSRIRAGGGRVTVRRVIKGACVPLRGVGA